ncbi:hypothetical protein SESBI_46072 [Sesbania bispinosa]|nr:hypothetical protein SESBI_46072 [Sesbania bispinosa]
MQKHQLSFNLHGDLEMALGDHVEVHLIVAKRRHRGVLFPEVDRVGNAASRLRDVAEGGFVELACDVEVVVVLVGLNGGDEDVVKVIGEVGEWICVRDVTEFVEVIFDIGEAFVFLARLIFGEVVKGFPWLVLLCGGRLGNIGE